MGGGYKNIDEYNKSLTPEERKLSAKKAAKAPRRKSKTIKEIAKIINEAPAQKAAKEGLKKLGLKDRDMTNAALIAAAVFRAAFEGNIHAVEKWEKLVGQEDKSDTGNGQLADLIDGLKEPLEDDIHEKAEDGDESLAEKQAETD